MQKIKYYSVAGGVCKTECPNGLRPKVGSEGCIKCECFRKDKRGYVWCNFPFGGKRENKVGKAILSILLAMIPIGCVMLLAFFAPKVLFAICIIIGVGVSAKMIYDEL